MNERSYLTGSCFYFIIRNCKFLCNDFNLWVTKTSEVSCFSNDLCGISVVIILIVNTSQGQRYEHCWSQALTLDLGIWLINVCPSIHLKIHNRFEVYASPPHNFHSSMTFSTWLLYSITWSCWNWKGLSPSCFLKITIRILSKSFLYAGILVSFTKNNEQSTTPEKLSQIMVSHPPNFRLDIVQRCNSNFA